MEFWRVLNWNPRVGSPEENGHPLFIWPRQGAGRVDDPYHEYLLFYVGDSPEGAISEAFGRFAYWSQDILDVPVSAPRGTVKALARYEGEPNIFDLDDPYILQEVGLRPSGVVSRNRAFTQQWAREIHDSTDADGLSWWSYYEPQWASVGLWNLEQLELVDEPEILTLDNPALSSAAATIRRLVT